jgi:hypothetical protein
MIPGNVLQLVLHPRPNDHQLVAIEPQLPQIADFTRLHPDARKPARPPEASKYFEARPS